MAVASLAAITTVALTPGIASATGPDPASVYIASISYGGSGCPQGTVGSSLSGDRRNATLIFDAFVASSGPGVPVTENRKNCQINLNLHTPRSVVWAAAITIAHRGYTQAPAGVNTNRSDVYYSPEILIGSPQDTTFTGPVAKDYLVTDNYLTSSLDKLLCKGEKVFPNNINAQVRVLGPAPASAQITTDSLDIAVEPQLVVPCVN
jgi:hypothetical protein